jgi:hypothetical protein
MRLRQDAALLSAALIGYQQKRAEIDKAIAEISARIDGNRGAAHVPGSNPTRKRKPLSAAARKRMAAAQKKRWATYRKRNAA